MQHKDFATKEEELKVMRFYQNDLNSAKLLINVTHDKVVTDFSTATKVQIAFLKPDGKRVFQDVQNVNQMQGKYYVVLSTQTLIVYGNVVAQLRLTFPDNKVIETCKFVFAVDESIMSDEAMKSTNEFPVIQKAIEAGEKLEGVDINGIIAAGAKADAALPKSGGTMTGNINMDTTANSKMITGYRNGKATSALYFVNDNVSIEDRIRGKSVWQFDSPSETFTLYAPNTNLVKKAGDSFTGTTSVNNDVFFAFKDANGVGSRAFKLYPDGKFSLRDLQIGKDIFDVTNGKFNVNVDTDLLKKTGDTMTGLLRFNSQAQMWLAQPDSATGASARGIHFVDNITDTSSNRGGIGRYKGASNGEEYLYMGFGSNPWDSQNGLIVRPDGTATLKGKKLATTDKDGQAALTLTADATNANSGYMPLAERRGNTVSMRMEITRNAGSASPLVCTLPVDMRPPITMSFICLANDGTPVSVNISWNGSVEVYTAGKQVKIAATYVVN
ncbi:BppU family phage baseplate upper protein [Bacillus paranthracis]|uniref:BppU family phage baseplate upper protein n=1 Tax=Bacillus paranthracis TaxID=2026186 RepID=UPI003855E41C